MCISRLEEQRLASFDSFICDSDEVAFGVVSALQDRGYEVPQDFSIIGYGGFLQNRVTLTSIVHNPETIAKKVVELFDLAMKGNEPIGVVVPGYLETGDTTLASI